MLFYASEKYPVENSYSKYITQVSSFILLTIMIYFSLLMWNSFPSSHRLQSIFSSGLFESWLLSVFLFFMLGYNFDRF